jgi:hypothetical protein
LEALAECNGISPRPDAIFFDIRIKPGASCRLLQRTRILPHCSTNLIVYRAKSIASLCAAHASVSGMRIPEARERALLIRLCRAHFL